MKLYLAIPKSNKPVTPIKKNVPVPVTNLKHMLKFVATKASTCKRCGG
jgi:hypothetical protein